MQFLYDLNKADQEGSKTTTKHVYANPKNAFICPYLSLGIYFCLNATKFVTPEVIFKNSNSEKKKIASQGYCSQLRELLNCYASVVINFIRLAHGNAHGWRKGAAMYAPSGTTCPPPIPSVARRGEWSMGKVLDVYWHCTEPGDNYLGRVLVGLNALSADFNILPPHFNVESPMENALIFCAMTMMYVPILDAWANTPNNPTGLLLRVLASVIYHFDWIKSLACLQTDHPFDSISLLFDTNLVEELRQMVTTDPSNFIREPTGIPPHV